MEKRHKLGNRTIVVKDFFGENEHLYLDQLGWTAREKQEARSFVSKEIFEFEVVKVGLNLAFYYVNNDEQGVRGYGGQLDPNANNLWSYFQTVLNWAITNFDMRKFKKNMKGLDWAELYDKYGSETLDTAALGQRISALMRDSEVQRQLGIIPYVLTGDEHFLDLRAFPEDIKLAVWEQQHHVCPVCGKDFDLEFMEGDHITPWHDGGRTVIENCQMLCKECNRRKGAK